MVFFPQRSIWVFVCDMICDVQQGAGGECDKCSDQSMFDVRGFDSFVQRPSLRTKFAEVSTSGSVM